MVYVFSTAHCRYKCANKLKTIQRRAFLDLFCLFVFVFFFSGDVVQPKQASAGGKKADNKAGAGSFKRASLQERLGITKKEAEKIRGDERTTAAGYSNLVDNPESYSNGGSGGGGSGSSSSSRTRSRSSRSTSRSSSSTSRTSSSTNRTSTRTSTSTSTSTYTSTNTSSRSRSSSSSGGDGLISTDTTPSSRSFKECLLDRLHVTKDDAKRLVLENPAALTMSGGAANAVYRWLEDKVDMDREEVARLLLIYPEAGQLSVEDAIKPAIAWLRKILCPEKADVGMVLRQAPQLLGQSIEGSLEPMVAMLESKLGVSRGNLAKIAYIFPAIFEHSVDNKRDPTRVWLVEQLISGDLSAMIEAAPNFRGTADKTGLEQTLSWLRDRVGMEPEEIRRVLRGYPSITYLSIDKILEPKLTWLKEVLGLDQNATKDMLVRYPRVMGASLDRNLKLKLGWLEKTLNLTKEEAVALVTRFPSLLSLSVVENLDPKIAFYRDEMGASDEDLRRHLVQNPRLMQSSLNERLRPRVAKMRLKNMRPRFSQHVHQIHRSTDEEFEKFLRSGGNIS